MKSGYGKGTRGSHCDNGHIYGFGSTQEEVFRRVKGAKQQGQPSDGLGSGSTCASATDADGVAAAFG